MTETKTKK